MIIWIEILIQILPKLYKKNQLIAQIKGWKRKILSKFD